MIAVFGLGGGGCNILAHLTSIESFSNLHMLNIDTDSSSLQKSNSVPFLLIGHRTCRGWGCGNSTEVGEMALIESRIEIAEQLYGVSKLFLLSSLGGGLGGAASVLATQAQSMGIEVISLVTTPFAFEGKLKAHIAHESQKRLESIVDTLITFSNEALFEAEKRPASLQASLRFFDTSVATYIAEEKSTCCL